MKVVNLTTRQLKKIPTLNLSSNIVNTEANLYIYTSKTKYNYVTELLKLYYNQEIDHIADKIAIISKLIATFESLDMEELVTPSALVCLDGEISGFTMPFIEDNVNLTLLLNNPKVKLSFKLQFLKKILAILIKINNSHELAGTFYLGDIHEANFIWDIMAQTVRAVDLDSAYFVGGPISVSKVLTYNHLLESLPNKYPIDEKSGQFIPNQETTSASFLYMLLNVLSGCSNSYRWSYSEFYQYLSYLNKKGLSKELLDLISKLYTSGEMDIYHPDLLDCIDTSTEYTLQKAKIPSRNGGYYSL